MRMNEALEIMNPENKEKGFMVSFEKEQGGLLKSGYFPDKHEGEMLIESEEEAWKLARKFADATKESEYVNIYVIDHSFGPVKDYSKRKIRAHSPIG